MATFLLSSKCLPEFTEVSEESDQTQFTILTIRDKSRWEAKGTYRWWNHSHFLLYSCWTLFTNRLSIHPPAPANLPCHPKAHLGYLVSKVHAIFTQPKDNSSSLKKKSGVARKTNPIMSNDLKVSTLLRDRRRLASTIPYLMIPNRVCNQKCDSHLKKREN